MGTGPPLRTRSHRALGALTMAFLTVAMPASPLPAWSEEPRVGVVAMLLGAATVTRAAQPAPALLRFKDAVFLRDRIVTGERSAVRVLLGGKATVTARERSILTITEVPAMSTVFLAAGRSAVAVSKAGMKPGETLEIKTPNAVAAIRGTFVVAEISPARSTITILRGLVEVTKLDPTTGRPVGPAVKVGAFQRVTVTDTGPIPAPVAITPETAKNLASDFTFLPKDAPAASVAPVTRAATAASIADVTHALSGSTTAVSGGAVTGATTPIGGGIQTNPPKPPTPTRPPPLPDPPPLTPGGRPPPPSRPPPRRPPPPRPPPPPRGAPLPPLPPPPPPPPPPRVSPGGGPPPRSLPPPFPPPPRRFSAAGASRRFLPAPSLPPARRLSPAPL